MTRSPRELAQQKIQMRKQQQKLFEDLLTVLDALDRASDHWQNAAQQNSAQNSATSDAQASTPQTWWQRWRQWLRLTAPPEKPAVSNAENLVEVVHSARDGIDIIRESMLSVLSQHQVEPLPVKGQPFDPNTMHALGQQVEATVSPQTVVQEVVRGYRWQDRVLREAKVIVAVAPEDTQSSDA